MFYLIQAKLFGRIRLHSWNTYLAPTTVAKWLHNRINFLFKHLREFSAKLIDPGSLAIVKPGVVKHQPDIIHILPGFLVLPSIQFTFNGWKIHRILHNVKVVLQTHTQTPLFLRRQLFILCCTEKMKCLYKQRQNTKTFCFFFFFLMPTHRNP